MEDAQPSCAINLQVRIHGQAICARVRSFRSVFTGRKYVRVIGAFRSVYTGRQYVRVLGAFRSVYTGRQYLRVLGAFRSA
jgi:ribosomal protein S19